MLANKRSGIDRRSPVDRRRGCEIDYFSVGGVVERRRGPERRNSGERRAGWARLTGWGSVFVANAYKRD